MLVNRQQLAQKDYRVNLRVAKVCEEDIHKYHCMNEISEVAGFKAAKMSAILLCLEAAVKDGYYHDFIFICAVKFKLYLGSIIVF